MKLGRIALALALVGNAVVLLSAGPAHAKTYKVTRFDDPAPDPAPTGCKPKDCSLREAIMAANASAAADTIQLKKGIYVLDRPVETSGKLADFGQDVGDLNIWSSLTVKGLRGGGTIITMADSGDIPQNGIFAVRDNDAPGGPLIQLKLSDLTLAGGSFGVITESNSAARLDRVVVRGARVFGGIVNQGGAVTIQSSSIGPNNWGGRNDTGGGLTTFSGETSATNTTFHKNVTFDLLGLGGGFGGGILSKGGTTTLNNVTIHDNLAEAEGDALYREAGVVTAANSIFSPSTSFAPTGGTTCGANADEDAFTTLDQNFIVTDPDDDCTLTSSGDSTGAAAGLGTLRYRGFGGLPNYYEPLSTSPVVDESSPADTGDPGACAAADQRGVKRPKDGDTPSDEPVCDTGAVEFINDTAKPKPTIKSVTRLPQNTVKAQWAGTDQGAGIESWDVYMRTRATKPGSKFGARKLMKENVGKGSLLLKGKKGVEYCFVAKALDKDGNESNFSPEKCLKVV